MPDPVYLDYNATTPLDPRILEIMTPWFLAPSNAGSRTHVFGQRAKDAVENARKQIADLIGAKAEEIFFTSGATESNNIAILGLRQCGEKIGRKHIISTTIEHKAVLEPLQQMKQWGFDVELAPVTAGGYVEPEVIQSMLRPDTLLVSVMHANNETGVLQPIHEIAEIIATHQKQSLTKGSISTLLHTDAAQTFGKEVDSLRSLCCDMLSISSHKIYGPQGIGALYVRRHGVQKRPIEALFFGGGQERGLRPGTVPVALAVGLGEAARLAGIEWQHRREHTIKIRNQLLEALLRNGGVINGDQTHTMPHVISVQMPGIESEAMMLAIGGQIAISNGSACTAFSYQPSHVLRAMGLTEDACDSTVRISWGPQTPEQLGISLEDTIRALRH
jgi:cysteine desulfurase